MPLRETLTSNWDHIQGFLFPMLREEAGPLTAQHERLVIVLDVARVETFVQMWAGLPGRPPEDRHALARAFVGRPVPMILRQSSAGSLPLRADVETSHGYAPYH